MKAFPILISILSVVGLLLRIDLLFVCCGIINFILFLLYFNRKCNDENESEYAEITKEFVNPEEIIKKKHMERLVLRIILYITMLGIFIWLFSWKVFIWSGVLFGCYLMPEILGKYKRKETLL